MLPCRDRLPITSLILPWGKGWQTTITYINYSPQEVSCRTEFLSDHGSPLLVSFAGGGTVVSRPDVLPPGGSVHQETNVELSAPLAPGWARATCSGLVKASLLFRRYDSEGVPVAEAGVNAATVPATRFVTFAEQGEGQFGTGVAYANPSATAALVTFTARDADGQMLASVDETLLPRGHGAKNMQPLFWSQQLYRIAGDHLHGAHRQSLAQFRSRSRILLLASGGTGCCRARIDQFKPSSSAGNLCHPLSLIRATTGSVGGTPRGSSPRTRGAMASCFEHGYPSLPVFRFVPFKFFHRFIVLITWRASDHGVY